MKEISAINIFDDLASRLGYDISKVASVSGEMEYFSYETEDALIKSIDIIADALKILEDGRPR